MRAFGRVLAAGLVTVTAVVGVAACSGDEVSAADVYRVGCPAVDTVAGGSSVAGKAALGGLQQLYRSQVLGDEAQAWLKDAIGVLKSGDTSALSDEAKTRLVDGCADHGHPLSNLKG